MLHINLKKSLLVGAVLSALSLNMAFAADNVTTKAISSHQQLTGTTKSLDADDILEDIFDLDDIDNLDDLKDILKDHHRHHQRHDWDDDDDWDDNDDWDDDDRRHHRHEIRKERKERVDEAMKHLSSNQKREVIRFIENDRKFHRERREALREMNDRQRQAVKAYYYGRHGHRGYGCHRG